MVKNGESRRVKSVDTACELIRAMQERGETTISELSDAIDLSEGSVHTHLATLKSHGLVVKDETTYELGPQFIPLGERVKHNSKLYQAAKKEIDRITEKTGECVHLLLENNGQGIILYESFGEKAVGTKFHSRSREKPAKFLHCRASGKAILAYLPDSRVHDIIDRYELKEMTKETITDYEELLDELATTRSQGYALNDEEELRGVRAVGVPILDDKGTPLGAISLSAPRSRLEGDIFTDEIPEILIDTANVIEINYQTNDLDIS
ncbi:IclR family transcriptional regulator [Halorubrum aethiopicum]|uniref:IclR family transcriptional regulator n=1 Tax=Halorubrum aethiopicum TaxID=1758255 RepID=UPI0008330B63|nr:IclR family transcriptional regulator [Halorubrum aethiopicum]